jgi:hypothetical protein
MVGTDRASSTQVRGYCEYSEYPPSEGQSHLGRPGPLRAWVGAPRPGPRLRYVTVGASFSFTLRYRSGRDAHRGSRLGPGRHLPVPWYTVGAPQMTTLWTWSLNAGPKQGAMSGWPLWRSQVIIYHADIYQIAETHDRQLAPGRYFFKMRGFFAVFFRTGLSRSTIPFHACSRRPDRRRHDARYPVRQSAPTCKSGVRCAPR